MPYKVLIYPRLDAETIRDLNRLESNGWKVVSHSRIIGLTTTTNVEVLLHKEAGG